MLRLVAISVTTLFLSGCPALDCGEGTHQQGEECLPNIPLKCGPGTKRQRGWCIVPDAVQPIDDTAEDDRDGQDL